MEQPKPSHPIAKGTAWAYLVVSSDQQASTLEDQRAWAERTAKQNGWRISRVVDGISSGKTGPRKLLARMVHDLTVAQRRPEYVLMLRLDRVGRGSTADSMIALKSIYDLGIKVVTREEGVVRFGDPTSELLANVRFMGAWQESLNRIDKALNVYEKRRREGRKYLSNRPPYGLVLVDGELRPDRKFRTCLSRAFAMRAAGKGFYLIGRYLNTAAPERIYKTGRKVRTVWTPSRVRRLLTNPAYSGLVTDELTWQRAQRASAHVGQDRPVVRKHPWPLGGALRCECGRILKGMCSGPDRNRTRYYVCLNAEAHGSNLMFRAERAEAAFLDQLETLAAKVSKARGTEAIERLWAAQPRGADPIELRQQLKAAKKRLAEISRNRERAWQAHAANAVTHEQLQARLERLDRDETEISAGIGDLETRLADVAVADQSRKTATELLRNAPTTWRGAHHERQREIARAIARTVGGLQLAKPMDIRFGL